MRVLGIDTSLTATGLALIDVSNHGQRGDGNTTIFHADISVTTVSAPKPGKDKSKVAMARRVNRLIEQIDDAFVHEHPDAVGIEGLAYSAGNASAWVLAWVFGRTVELAERYDVPLTVVATSARAKYATGKGNAPKDTVLLTAAALWPNVGITDNNEADATIVGAAVAHQHGRPILPVTQYRLDVLDKLGD